MNREIPLILVPVYVRPMTMVQEQACIGFFARSKQDDFYVYRLAKNDDAVKARVLGFFPNMQAETLSQVFEWAENDIAYTFDLERKGDKAAFYNLVRPRENLVRYGEPQMVIIHDLEADLDRLYHRCVGV